MQSFRRVGSSDPKEIENENDCQAIRKEYEGCLPRIVPP